MNGKESFSLRNSKNNPGKIDDSFEAQWRELNTKWSDLTVFIGDFEISRQLRPGSLKRTEMVLKYLGDRNEARFEGWHARRLRDLLNEFLEEEGEE